MTFQRTDILLPDFSADKERMQKWSVVACDQYTSEPEYWNAVSAQVGEDASTLNLTVPEIYLNDADIDERIARTNAKMEEYKEKGMFCEYKNSLIFVERTLKSGAKRYGVVGAVDLEDYDFSVGSKTKIRATEGTVVSRIPPRLRVRCEASVELPHIMILIDDDAKKIIEPLAEKTNEFELLYDFDLMQDSGHIKGYKMSDAACDLMEQQLLSLENMDAFNKKYGVSMDSALVFAMGDGNHSLATAKTHYENLKKEIGEENAKQSPARYALCELVNLHDSSLEFEAIHRVVFEASGEAFLDALSKEYELSFDANDEGQKFELVLSGEKKTVVVKNPKEYLTVATVQKALDAFVAASGGEIDYIHGEDVVLSLAKDEKNFGILFDAMDKADLYKSVILDGALPRKTFSMGEACDKRFYIEARKIN